MAKKPLLMTDLRLETNRDDLKPKVEEGADTGTKTEQPSFDYKSYVESPDVTKARNDMNSFIANKPQDWTGGTYGAALNDAVNKILNREKFSYDLNGDALYQQYKDQYMNAGKIAMNDTIGQASAMTGGYGNSYAATAGNQAYQGYLQNLNNVVPELYQLAFSKYNQEGQNLLDNYNAINSAYNQEYGQHRDSVNDWYTEANRLVDAYQGAYSMDYGRYADDFNRSLSAFKQNFTGTQYANELALEKSKNDFSALKSDYEAQLNDAKSSEKYYNALVAIGDGIKPVTRGGRGNTSNGGYIFMGTTYKSEKEAENALVKYLDSLDLTNEQINAIYDKLGM